MARTINVEEATSWDDEELETNLAYLDVRCRYSEIDRIHELRSAPPPKKKSSKAAKEDQE